MDFCDCSSLQLTSIPSTLPRQMKGLDLSNNLIQTISDDELKPYENLRVLCLYGNEIHSITNNSFQSLQNLEELDLSYNKLPILSSDWFGGLHKLRQLNLLGNHYTLLGEKPLFSTLPSLRNLKFGNLEFSALSKQDFDDFRSVYKVVHTIKSVTCTDSKVFLMPCDFSRSFKMMTFLDLSGNVLTDMFLESTTCYLDGFGAWPSVQTLNVSRNLLSSLTRVSKALSKIPSLTYIDLSQNMFGDTTSCIWPKNLLYLNISDCKLKLIDNCIPVTLEILDVSANHLEKFTSNLTNLKELYISNNRLAMLPGNAYLPSLTLLVIRENSLHEFFQSDLGHFPNLTRLDAGDNIYFCSCQFVDLAKQHNQILLGWPENYICDSPPSVRGYQIKDAHLPILMCHRTLVVTVSCIASILVLAIIVLLCHCLHCIWYAKMTWAWLKAKRMPLRVSKTVMSFDAFISYSEMDSEWVENMMIPQLENGAHPLRVCIHKRDFVPGKWIIDNIIDAMERSHKTLFILSEHFVQSEWCKYELEFSHFRLFDENNDTAILVVLEPIEKATIPKRFCKLRKLMNTKTYLEWPSEEEEQHIFWDKLKAAVQQEGNPEIEPTI
ncbi:unnamed protein product [Ranitomeya imitator]|uniref:TIR domain-containing protein n=1 Tax=Ranitomeya imitator TaxID=111125 RepID=A0ABN9MPJ4_9NEOB|nr:unnamed protein product [Ranitomeya imitator]